MQISLTGINHQTAPVAVREKLAVSQDGLEQALCQLKIYTPEGVILSTCNRTEVYAVDNGPGPGEQAGLAFFRNRLASIDEEWQRYIYRMNNLDAARHLFRVASGLESMVVGEFEVLGQVRQALEAAEKAESVGLPLRHIFTSAIHTSRLVRESTDISKNPISVSSVAVDLAAKAVRDLGSCKMLIIGAGEAGRLVAKVANERGVKQIVVGSRTKDRAQEVAAALHGKAINLEALNDELGSTDIVVTCATAPHPLVGVQQIESIMKKRPDSPLVIIDIAVPRNVAPDAGSIKNVFLYTIDNLTEISNANRQKREGAIQQTETIIEAEMQKITGWWNNYEVMPLIGALMGKAENIRTAQLEKTMKYLVPLSDDQKENLESMTKSIVTRILQDPIQCLKENGNGEYSKVFNDLFRLGTENN